MCNFVNYRLLTIVCFINRLFKSLKKMSPQTPKKIYLDVLLNTLNNPILLKNCQKHPNATAERFLIRMFFKCSLFSLITFVF